MCRGKPLPFNGSEWEEIRNGKLQDFSATFELKSLIKAMCAVRVEDRPNARDLLGRRVLMSESERALLIEKNRVRDLNSRMDVMQKQERGVTKTRLQRASTWTG